MAMRPRTIGFLAGALVVVLAIVGAVVYNATKSSSAASSATVTWWVPDWDYDQATKIVETFEADSGTTVELVKTTGDTVANRTGVALDSGNVPDVITESIARVRGYAGKGQLADVSGLYGSDLPAEDFAPGLLDAVRQDGKTFAVPYRWATNALIYNPKLFAAAGIDGPPQTWAEFEEDAKTLTKGDVVGTAWPMAGEPSDLTLRLLDFAVSDGSTITDGAPELTELSVKSSLDLIGGSVADGWASKSSFELDNTGIRELFLQGRVAMYLGGVFDVDAAVKQNAPIATSGLPGPDGIGTAQGVGWAYVVPAKAPHAEAAQKLVTFLGQPANMAALTLTFPARVSAASDPKFQTELRKAYVTQLSEHSIPAANDPRWTSSVRSVRDDISKVALGQESSSAAATAIVDRTNAAFGR